MDEQCWAYHLLWTIFLLRQDPREAILLIFGGRALIFFVWKPFANYEKWKMKPLLRSDDHLEDAKMSKKGTSLRRIELFY